MLQLLTQVMSVKRATRLRFLKAQEIRILYQCLNAPCNQLLGRVAVEFLKFYAALIDNSRKENVVGSSSYIVKFADECKVSWKR